MAQWVPNPIYGDPNGGDFIDDMGKVWPDPTGALRNTPGAAPASGGFQLSPEQAAATSASPENTTPAPPTPALLTSNQMNANLAANRSPFARPDNAVAFDETGTPKIGSPPDPAEVMSRSRASSAPAAAPPDPAHSFAASPFAQVTQTTTDRTRSTSGLDEESKGKVQAATDQANAAVEAEGQAQIDQQNATAELERKQARDAYARGTNQYFEAWGQKQVQDQIVRETTQRLDENSKFKPDRSALFRGDNGLLFGIASAVAAMAGGWMMGRGQVGSNPFLPTIMKMIDDDANDQIAQNSAVYRELTRRLGSAEAAQKELKARMLGAVQDTIEAQTRFEKSEIVQKGAAAVLAQVEAKKAQNSMDAAKLTANTVTNQVQTRTQSQMVPNPQAYGGVDVTDPKEYARVGKVADLQNFANEIEGLNKDGTLAANVGFFDEKWNAVKEAFNARDPGQARVKNLQARWELLNRADWASEPNGAETQRRLSLISFPQNDGEIPAFMQRVREVLNESDPGGRYRFAAKAMGSRPNAVETRRIPIVR